MWSPITDLVKLRPKLKQKTLDSLKDDQLKYLFYLTAPFFVSKYFRVASLMLLLLNSSFLLIHCWYCVYYFNKSFFAKYFHSFTLLLFGTASICNRFRIREFTDDLLDEAININRRLFNANENAKREIDNEIFVIKLFYGFFSLAMVPMVYGLIFLGEKRDSSMISYYILREFFPKHWRYLYRLHSLSVAFLFYYALDISNIFIYFTSHGRFGLYSLNCDEEANDIKKPLRRNVIELHDDEAYNEKVNKWLRKWYLGYSKLFLYAIKGRTCVQYFCYSHMLTAIAFIISCLGRLNSSATMDLTEILENCSTIICFILVAGITLHNGQKTEDITNEVLRDLNENIWYVWNKKNKYFLLSIMTITTKPVRLDISENYALNYQLGLAIYNLIVTIAAAFVNFSDLII